MNFVKMALHQRCTGVHFSIQPTCTPARNGWHRVPTQGMRAVGQSVCVVSNFSRYSGVQIHSLGQHAFQAVGSYMRHSGKRSTVIRSQLEKTGYSPETGYPKDRLIVNFLICMYVCMQQQVYRSRQQRCPIMHKSVPTKWIKN